MARPEPSKSRAALFRDLHVERFDEKSPAVGGVFDDFCGPFAGAMTGFSFDSNQPRNPFGSPSAQTVQKLTPAGQCERKFRRRSALRCSSSHYAQVLDDQ